jgi:cytochrome c553
MSKNHQSDENLMGDHDYDGIKELDNDLPPWWIMLFVITIIFSVVYLAYYHVFDLGMNQIEVFQAEMKAAENKGKQSSGKSLFAMNCISCHGNKGQGIDSIKAPQIAGQSKWYLTRQMKNFRSDIRGSHPQDISGVTMKNIAKTVIKNDDEIEILADYVSSLKGSQIHPTFKADIEKGKATYQGLCIACHGVDGKGNKQMNSPSLTKLNDWYMVSQLHNFKKGYRGKDDRDLAGKTMAPMALALSKEDMKNVSAYILSLNSSGK